MVRHLFRKHQRESFGAFSICRLCGTLECFINRRYSYNFRGENLTYAVLKDLQSSKQRIK